MAANVSVATLNAMLQLLVISRLGLRERWEEEKNKRDEREERKQVLGFYWWGPTLAYNYLKIYSMITKIPLLIMLK